MSSTATLHPVEPAERHDFLMPPRHRLFAAFDDRRAAETAVARLRFEGYVEEDDIWVLSGDDGLRVLDPAGTWHGWRGRLVRLFERVMTNPDTEYLQVLGEEVRSGHVVLALLVQNERTADQVARVLRSQSGHSFAYGAHWDFVPVVP